MPCRHRRLRLGVAQRPGELQRVIGRQVAEGKAASASAFVEAAVRRLVDDARGEEDERLQVSEAGSAGIEAGLLPSDGIGGKHLDG